MKKWYMLIAVVLLVALVSSTFGCAKPPRAMRMESAGAVTGSYFATVGMAEMWRKYANLSVTVTPYTSVVETMKLLDRGEMDIAWTPDSFAFDISKGTGGYKDYGKRKFYTLIRGGRSDVFILTTDPKIKSVRDWRGKRVAGEYVGSFPTNQVRQAILKANGMTDDDIKLIKYTGVDESIRQLKEGVVDVAYTQASPITPGIQELAMAKDIYFIPLSDAEIEAVRAVQPFRFKEYIPAGVYKGLDYKLPTASGLQGIFVRLDFEPELAYKMIKAIYDHQEEFLRYHAGAALWAFEYAAEKGSVVFPFAPGAIKYYKEKGIWTSEHEAAQNKLLKELGF